jgi:hypothetical protein
MTASYTFDVFSTLDAFGSPSPGSWGGHWGKQGSELLEHRVASYGEQQRMVFGPIRIGCSRTFWPRAPRSQRCMTHGSPG